MWKITSIQKLVDPLCRTCIISQKVLPTFLPCSSSSSSSFEEAYLNSHKTNDLGSLHVEMHHYRIGNRGLVVHILLIVISPCNVL